MNNFVLAGVGGVQRMGFHWPAGKTIVFTNGCFDIFHAGHAWFLQRCRAMGTHLVVGLNTDESIRNLKGPHRPICRFQERADVLMALRSVDEVLPFDEPTPCRLIEQLRPHVIVKGPGYSEANMPEAAVVRGYGGRVEILDGPPISSSKIIDRVIGTYFVPPTRKRKHA